VDICGNASPILIEKDAQIRSGKCSSPRSSSSDSESSSSGLCLTVFILICIISMIRDFADCCENSLVFLTNTNISLVLCLFCFLDIYCNLPCLRGRVPTKAL
jgi:hypothetical protein